MTAEIIRGRFTTTLPLNPDDLLEANKGEFSTLVLVGYGKDGRLIFGSSDADLGIVNLILDQAKREVLALLETDQNPTGAIA